MENQVTPFVFEEQEVRALIDEKGNSWWVAKDVCEILGLSDVSISLKNLDEDEKLIQTLFVSGQNRDILTINEPCLYRLILRSNKPNAKQFSRWVYHEVLPKLRQTGRYQNPGYVAWLKEQRLAIAEERKYIEFAQALADRIVKNSGSIDILSKTPCLKKTVQAMIDSDPRMFLEN